MENTYKKKYLRHVCVILQGCNKLNSMFKKKLNQDAGEMRQWLANDYKKVQ